MIESQMLADIQATVEKSSDPAAPSRNESKVADDLAKPLFPTSFSNGWPQNRNLGLP
jgi:hypothetical protein